MLCHYCIVVDRTDRDVRLEKYFNNALHAGRSWNITGISRATSIYIYMLILEKSEDEIYEPLKICPRVFL